MSATCFCLKDGLLRVSPKNRKMIDQEKMNSRAVEQASRIYQWLDGEIRRKDEDRECLACGKCCDFEVFDHRLFVTPPELMHLAANLPEGKFRRMPSGRCPYNIDGKCTIYEHRFAGCRIFACSGDADLQSRLSEATLKRLKSICENFDIPYRYIDLPSALNNP